MDKTTPKGRFPLRWVAASALAGAVAGTLGIAAAQTDGTATSTTEAAAESTTTTAPPETTTTTAVGDERHVAGGIELWPASRSVAIRAGVSANTTGDARPAGSVGASVALRSKVYCRTRSLHLQLMG